jgi:hypothetical protein
VASLDLILLAVGVVHDDGPAADFLPVEGLNSPLALILVTHHNESEAAGATRVTIENYFGGDNFAVGLEKLLEILVGL